MKRKSAHPNFDQTLELLRAHGFEVAPFAGVPGRHAGEQARSRSGAGCPRAERKAPDGAAAASPFRPE